MPDNNIVPRPLWVRFFARPGSQRSAVRAGAWAQCLLAILALLLGSLSAGRETILGRISFFFGAVIAPIMAALAVGSFLALRWVDRNGGWK